MPFIKQVDFADCALSIDAVCDEAYKRVGKELVNQLSTVGFAYLKHTGAKKLLYEKFNDITEQFFLCPVEEKLKYKRNLDNNFGYNELEAEVLDTTRPADLKEAFNAPTFTLDQESYKWPDDLVPGFSSVYKEFMLMGIALSKRVLTALSFGMNLHKDDFLVNSHEKMGKHGNSSALRTLYYPALKTKSKPGQLRCGEHSDYGSITLLFQDGAGGLQVMNTSDEYVDAEPVEDSVIVNIGDCLQFQTKGILKSTKHRVLIPDDVDKQKIVRRSLAFFVQHDDDVVVNRPLRYGEEDQKMENVEDPVTSLQWLQRRYAVTY